MKETTPEQQTFDGIIRSSTWRKKPLDEIIIITKAVDEIVEILKSRKK